MTFEAVKGSNWFTDFESYPDEEDTWKQGRRLGTSEDYVLDSGEIVVVDNYFYISIYSCSSVRNQVARSLQNLYRT